MFSFIEKNHYERLGVTESATSKEIKLAYRKLARTYHPDVAGEKEDAREIFVLINEAHKTLHDEKLRSAYDVSLSRQSQVDAFTKKKNTRSPFVKTKSDKKFYKPAGSRSNFCRPESTSSEEDAEAPMRDINLDTRASVKISLEDALNGAVHSLIVECNGGKVFKASRKTYKIQIPKNMWQGQQLRLKHGGFEDLYSRRKGSLYLSLEYKKHEDFQLIDDNLLAEIDVKPWVADAGGHITVPTLKKDVRVAVPIGARSGQRIWLKGEGMPRRDGSRGDLIVVIKVEANRECAESTQESWQRVAV